MNVFAGNITIPLNIVLTGLEYDYIESMTTSGDKNIFIYGETKLKTGEELVKFFTEKFGKLLNYDLSISTEDKIKFINGEYENDGIYRLLSFEGEGLDFEEVYEIFRDFEEVVSIREAETSNKFGNKVIKADFIY